MRASDFIVESATTLRTLYDDKYPDRDEEFWNHVRPSDFNTKLTIHTMSRHLLQIQLLSQYRVEHLDEITDMLSDEQQEIIEKYMNDATLSNRIIVLSDNRIIDGNHRALAAALSDQSIKYVDLSELDEQDLD